LLNNFWQCFRILCKNYNHKNCYCMCYVPWKPIGWLYSLSYQEIHFQM